MICKLYSCGEFTNKFLEVPYNPLLEGNISNDIAVFSKVCRVLYLCQKLRFMNTISIHLNVPQGWHELDDAQLRYVYSLIAKEFAADEIKTLALLSSSSVKL